MRFRKKTNEKAIIFYYIIAIVIPCLLLGVLAFRGIKNDQALVEREQRRALMETTQKIYQDLEESLVTIENSCEENLTDIAWNLTVTGGILNRINQQHNCTIEELAPGEHADVYSSKMFGSGSLLGFGKVTVKITAEVDGDEYTETFLGLVIGKLFIDRTIKIL